jgi:hypothetical protein
MTLKCGCTGRQDAYVVGTSLHSGRQAEVLYSGGHEQRPLRVARIGVNTSMLSMAVDGCLSRGTASSMQLCPRSTAMTDPGLMASCENACITP